MRLKVKIIEIGGAFLLLTTIAIAQTNQGGLEYKRETLFETKPWVSPFFFPLHYGQNSYHFEHKQTGRLKIRASKQDTAFVPMAPMVDYFWALNSGKLVFIDKNQGVMKSGTISVLDYENGGWKDYLICKDYHDYFSNIWTGTNDEIYFNYYPMKEPVNSDGSRFHLKKYDLRQSRWIIEPEYSPIPLAGPSALAGISPSGKIYLYNNDLGSYASNGQGGIYNKSGKFISTATADGETIYGLPFNFSAGKHDDTGVKSIIEMDRTGLLHEKFGGLPKTDFRFKATFDSLIITYKNRTIDTYSEDNRYLPINLPSVVVFNPIGGQALEINLADSIDSNYKYYSVSDIGVNHKGEIYALFVYFDNPYRITGNEQIVLYRWVRVRG